MNQKSRLLRFRATCSAAAIVLALVMTGCGNTNNENAEAPGTGGVFVTTSEYGGTGGYAIVDIDALTAWTAPDIEQTADMVSSDNVVASYGGKVFVLNRSLDNITVIDTADFARAVIQFSTGSGSNPHAMAFASNTKAYVSLYGEDYVLVLDPTDGTELGRIDISGFADEADGLPEASPMAIVGDKLFVAVQRLDRNGWFAPTGVSYLVVIDTTTDEVVDVNLSTPDVTDPIVLTGTNPQYMRYDEALDKLVVSETGVYSVQDGGLETVDPITYEAEGFFAAEATLGGDVGDFVVVGENRVYAVVTDVSWNNDVVFAEKDASGWSRTGALGLSGAFIPSLALTGTGQLLVPDRTGTAPGLRVFDGLTGVEITTVPLDVGLPPSSIAIL